MNAMSIRPARRHAVRLALPALLATVGVVGVAAPFLLPRTLGAQETSRQREKNREKVEEKQRVKAREKARTGPRPGGRPFLNCGAQPCPSRLDTTVTVDPRASVALALQAGRITVRAWDRAEVRVVAQVEGGSLGFEAGAMRVLLGDQGGAGDGRYEVTMPRGARLSVAAVNTDVEADGVQGGLEVESATGDVRLTNVGGPVRAELMAGSLRIARGDGDFRIALAAGDVILDDVAGRLEAETVSGDITARGARLRELRLETTSGSLTYEGTVVPDGRYELVTHSGDVRLRLPDGTRARLDAETYNGEFSSDFPVTMQPGAPRGTRRRRYELHVGDGTGPLIRVGSFNGDIHLGRASSGTRPDSTRNDR